MGFVKLALADELTAPALVYDSLPLIDFGVGGEAMGKAFYECDRPRKFLLSEQVFQLVIGFLFYDGICFRGFFRRV